MEITWPRLYHQRIPRSHQQNFNTKYSTQSKDAQDSYNEQIIQEIKSNLHLETTITNKWNLSKSMIKNAAESQEGYNKKENSKYISDPEIERMSKEQKDLKRQIQKCQNHEQMKQIRKSRKKIHKQMSHKMKDAKEKLAEDLVGEIENAKDDKKMFKAAKVMYTKHQRVRFAHDEQGQCISQPQEIQKIIEKVFKNLFKKDNTNPIEKFITPPKRRNNMITAKEVAKTVQKMANNKAPGKDNINVKLIKYEEEEVHQEISKILNGIFETNNEEVKLETGVLLPLPKPKKDPRTSEKPSGDNPA